MVPEINIPTLLQTPSLVINHTPPLLLYFPLNLSLSVLHCVSSETGFGFIFLYFSFLLFFFSPPLLLLLNSMMSGRNRFPFTASQWQELEHQALIFKYMVSGIPIPPDLLFSIKRSYLDSAMPSKLFPHHPQHSKLIRPSFCFSLFYICV